MSYQEPEWAQIPPPEYHQWFLLEIKGGVEVAKYPLHSRKCTILGRAADQVHIPLSHESISRQHARIAFDSQGIPWLRDLQSTHGTTCNKKRLPPLAVGKQETNVRTKGARGVMIYPGDVLQFGASTRIYCVEGPAEFERGAIQARQIQQEQLQQQHMEQPAPTTERNNRDDEDHRGDETDQVAPNHPKIVPMDAEVPEKHRKSLERLNAMKYKLKNLETEDDRIRRKGDLSEGQERQLQRNAEKEKALQQSIAELETELYDKLHPEQRPTGTKSHEGHGNDDEDDDDFFDRTKREHKSVVQDGESEATLISKWKQIHKEYSERQATSIQAAQATLGQLEDRHAELLELGDTEEAFFVQNNVQLAKDALDKLLKEQKVAEENMSEIEGILRIVNSKITIDRNRGYIGVGEPPRMKPMEEMGPPSSFTSAAAIPSRISIKKSIEDDLTQGEHRPFSMAPPPPRTQKSPTHSTVDHVPPNETVLPDMAMPPPKRKRVVGPAMPPPWEGANTRDDNPKPVRKGYVQGTAAFLSSSTAASYEEQKKEKLPTAQEAKVGVDLRKDEWRAPAEQDGSGITKLNAKFAGRY
jgi:pSer/pThr/pTyr-binding forkhead associated (FHA) protein